MKVFYRAYLAGVLHGDGWCTEKSLGLRVKDHDFAEAFGRALNAVMGVSIAVRQDERGYWTVRASNKTGRFGHLRAYEPTNHKERAVWLRGLFDSEGNAQCFKLLRWTASYQRRIAMYSTDFGTLEKASAHLSVLGMAHVIRATKNSATHKGSKTVFELSLQRRAAFQTFPVVVGSSIQRKQTVLDLIAATFHDPLIAARARQKKAAAAKHARTMEITLPRVIGEVRALIAKGVKPTQQNCRVVPGYSSVQPYIAQSELVARASTPA